MKILTVVFSLTKGGTQKAAQVFCEAYKEKGHDSRILVTEKMGVRAEELIKSGFCVWHLCDKNVLSEIEFWNPDIVHLHSHGLKNEHVNEILDVLSKDIVVVETNVFSIPSLWADSIDISFQLSKWCDWLFHLRSKKYHHTEIVPYPINCSKYYRSNYSDVKKLVGKFNIPRDKLVIGRIGQSYPGKWSLLIIDIFSELRDIYNLHLLLVNPPQNIIDGAKKSKYASDITIIDEIIGDENLRNAYSAIDIFLHIAEQGESFGYVLTEAMLCEVPVVTLSTPWGDNSQCEVVGNCIGGIVAVDKKSLKEAVELLIEKPELRKKIGLAGRNKVISDYDHLIVAQKALGSITSLQKQKPTNGDDIVEIYMNSLGSKKWMTMQLLRHGMREYLKLFVGHEPPIILFKKVFIKKASYVRNYWNKWGDK